MSGSTISGSVSVGITLDSSQYPSPLTITKAGSVYPTSNGSTAITVDFGGGLVDNSGTITGGTGGGIGVRLFTGELKNRGLVSGGYGGGGGGYAVELFGGTISNSGTLIAGGVFTSAVFQLGGTIVNDGVIVGNGRYGVQIDAGYLINYGTLKGGSNDNNGLFVGGGTVINQSIINGVSLDGGILINSGTIFGVASRYGGTFTNSGFIGLNTSTNEAVRLGTGASLIVLDPGATFGGAVVATGQAIHQTIELASASNAGIFTGVGSTVSGFGNIVIDDGAKWTLEGSTSGLASGQEISGFGSGDTLILDGFTETSFAYVSGTGIELAGSGDGTTAATIDITGAFTQDSFTVENNEAGTEILVCYLKGTRILTPAGEAAVEDLRIGDAVVTKFGGYRKVKWIGRQSYDRWFVRNNREQMPVRFRAGALGGGVPRRDLYVSPGHSMLIDGVLVLAKALVNGVTITQDQAPEAIHYYQLEFETHDCVMAEGAWSESYADTPDWREKFHNAAEFYGLYPSHVAPAQQVLCAPRPMAGPALERVLRPIVAAAAAGIKVGKLLGYVDEFSADGLLRGWALDVGNPQLPVLLEIVALGRVIGTLLACEERDDVARAGFDAGHCGFTFNSTLGLPKTMVEVRRVADGASLWVADGGFIAA